MYYGHMMLVVDYSEHCFNDSLKYFYPSSVDETP